MRSTRALHPPVKTLLLACLFLVLMVPAALGGGLSLNWGTVCFTEAPANFKAFACDTNGGPPAVMTASFVLDSTMSDMVGVEWTIEGESDSPVLPDWWQLGVAPDCRAGRATFTSDYTGVESGTCVDWTAGGGVSAPSYTWSGNRVTINLGTVINDEAPYTAVAGQEYYAGGVRILNQRTVGEGACPGCSVGMRFWISTLAVTGRSGRRDVFSVPRPGGNQFLRWNTHEPTVPTATSLSSDPNPSPLGDVVTLTAVVTPDGATGPVTFRDGTRALGVSTLSGGVATLGVASLAEGEHSFTAAYDGDFDRGGSVSPILAHTVSHRAPTSVALTASPAPSTVGRPVLLTAVVSPPDAGGSVEFRDGGVPLGAGVLSGGVATLTTSSLAVGEHVLSAVYGGDGTYLAGQSPELSHTVSPRLPVTVTVTVTPSPAYVGSRVLVTATVFPPAAGGTVTFYETVPRLPLSPGVLAGGEVTLHDGVATATSPMHETGRYTYRAVYSGDSTYAASQSSFVLHTVYPLIITTTALTASPSPSPSRDTVLLVATVSPATATGTVSFAVGGASLGTAVLGAGVAVLPVPGLCGGSHSLVASYGGDAEHDPSTSPAVDHAVEPGAPATVVVTSNLDPAVFMYEVVFTARVSDSATHPCAPSGTVQFVLDGTNFGPPVALSNGVATSASTVSLACGPHEVHAVYSGNASFPGSTSASFTQEVLCNFEPVLLSVRDQPDDQGGYVTVAWNASCLDRLPFGQIESYRILRSVPPAPGWEHVASHPATHAATYRWNAPTTRDSVAGSNPLTAFKIETRVLGGRESWFSDPDSGYSVDNLAPAAPSEFVALQWDGSTKLYWSPVNHPDVAGYRIYRGAVAGFVPGPENFIASTALSSHDDAVAELYYYELCAVDVHGNAGPFSGVQAVAGAGTPEGESFSFALEGVRPNPATGGAFRVQFVLPQAGPARLALYDLGGRCVAFREVGSLGPGRHQVDLAEGGRFAPGVYLVRLTRGALTRTTRAVVLR